jgi:hypothetical protein
MFVQPDLVEQVPALRLAIRYVQEEVQMLSMRLKNPDYAFDQLERFIPELRTALAEDYRIQLDDEIIEMQIHYLNRSTDRCCIAWRIRDYQTVLEGIFYASMTYDGELPDPSIVCQFTGAYPFWNYMMAGEGATLQHRA